MKVNHLASLEILSYEIELEDGRKFQYKECWDAKEGLIDTDISASFTLTPEMLEQLNETLEAV